MQPAGYGGATARQLVSKYEANIEAFTISKAQYEYATSVAESNINPSYHLRDWCANEIESESADVAISVESSEHFVDKKSFFQKHSEF